MTAGRVRRRRYVGQDGILRRVGNPSAETIGRPITNRPQDAILPHSAAKPQAFSDQPSALRGGRSKISAESVPEPASSRSRLCNSCGRSVRLQSRARKQAGSVILQFPQRAAVQNRRGVQRIWRIVIQNGAGDAGALPYPRRSRTGVHEVHRIAYNPRWQCIDAICVGTVPQRRSQPNFA